MDEKYEARLEAGRGKDKSGRAHQVPLLSVVVGVAIVIFVITISVLALVKQQQEGHRVEVGRRRVVHHSEPHFEHSLLLARLGRGSPVLEAPETGLSDMFISVKTSRKFHETRLGVVLGTWWQQARDSTYFFTDEVKRSITFSTARFSLTRNITNGKLSSKSSSSIGQAKAEKVLHLHH